MPITHIRPAQYMVSQWSGGKTTQLAIAPEGAVYADRNFLWRLSSATVELEQSDFTSLPSYDRLISVLQGEMRLRHDGGQVIELAPYTVHAFDGGTSTRSWGRCTDFNLMLRKGRCQGSLQSLCSERCGTADLTPPAPSRAGFHTLTVAVYCGEGGARVSQDSSCAALLAGETALLEMPDFSPIRLEWEAGTRLMLAYIYA